ncbi:CDP-glycerol glycerophosphotransferase family protein [Neobacillus sp.]|uniref:CDP-glycerol glycerophosphotransferase family protein n=1 Tax=Neobacillus sp. TaxID=2675273 RepID=UPI0035B546E8
MDIIIYGTGSTAEKVLAGLNSSVKVVAVTDNNQEKWGHTWHGFKIIAPSRIKSMKVDYILIASMFTGEIIQFLQSMGISRDILIPYYDNFYTEEDRVRERKIRNNLFTNQNNKKIALLTRRNSGCNCRALMDFIPENIKNTFDVSLIGLDEYKNNWMDYEVLFTTNIEGRMFKNRLNFETWHGFPLKTLGVFEKNLTDNLKNTNIGIDYMISYSNMYSYIMSSLFKIDINKFIVTGMPRNDYLINPHSRTLIEKLIKREVSDKQILFYLPTFRRRQDKQLREGNRVFSDIEELQIIDDFLDTNNGCLIIKKHPVEGDNPPTMNFRNIYYINEMDLEALGIDLYQILGGSNLLITDYSSVYFDYLLLNKPIVFWTKDQEQYEEKRGFLFDNLEFMMPGPHVKHVSELKSVLERFRDDPNWYVSQRTELKKMVHHFDDFNSSERVWNYFNKIY